MPLTMILALIGARDIKTHGYQLSTQNKGVKSVVTTPFADDFNVITHDKNMHQKLVTDISKKI